MSLWQGRVKNGINCPRRGEGENCRRKGEGWDWNVWRRPISNLEFQISDVEPFGLRIYLNTPAAFMVARKVSLFFALMATSGRRYSSCTAPISAKAAFTGTGFVSMNKSLKSG
jgi:hypothetical protein